MLKKLMMVGAVGALMCGGATAAYADTPLNDAQIAHIAYTAGQIDIDAAKQALSKSTNKAVRSFAEEMVRDHGAVNVKALALVKKLGVTPEANSTSAALTKQATAERAKLAQLKGAAFSKAYVANEIAYHKAVNAELRGTLIPDAKNAELKTLLETGLTLFTEHQTHAEHLSKRIR